MMFAGQNNVPVKQTNIMITVSSEATLGLYLEPNTLNFVPSKWLLSKTPKYCHSAMIIKSLVKLQRAEKRWTSIASLVLINYKIYGILW